MITASIVTYHTNAEELEKVIACLRRSPVERLYIIDNACEGRIRNFAERYRFIKYIPSTNVGYGRGHNIGIRQAIKDGSDYHLVMNSDITWTDPVIEEAIKYMEDNKDVGQLMPKIYYPDGSVQYQCKLVPTPKDLILKRFVPHQLNKKLLNRFQLEFTGYDHIMDVPFLSGCFMLFRVSALEEIGLFDERFFLYLEDVDMTRRMHERYRTVYFPKVSITHVYGRGSRRNLRLFMVHTVNMIRYFNKWGWFSDDKRRQINDRLLKAEAYKG